MASSFACRARLLLDILLPASLAATSSEWLCVPTGKNTHNGRFRFRLIGPNKVASYQPLLRLRLQRDIHIGALMLSRRRSKAWPAPVTERYFFSYHCQELCGRLVSGRFGGVADP